MFNYNNDYFNINKHLINLINYFEINKDIINKN